MSVKKFDFDFSWIYKDFEIRTTHTYGEDEKPYLELVKWNDEFSGRKTCFTLAYWHWDNEGCELRFVCDRPMDYIAEVDLSPIWKQLWLSQQMFMDAWKNRT